MNRSKLLIAFAFSLTLIGCGGGDDGGGGNTDTAAKTGETDQDQQTGDTDTSPQPGNDEPVEEAVPEIELSTVPDLQGFGELIPPGVPRLN